MNIIECLFKEPYGSFVFCAGSVENKGYQKGLLILNKKRVDVRRSESSKDGLCLCCRLCKEQTLINIKLVGNQQS